MSEWQDISTAPKDGTAVLLFEPMESRFIADGFVQGPRVGEMLGIGVGHWIWPDWSEPYWADYFDGDRLMSDPTHWMPLPPPPSPHTEKEE